MHCRKCGTEKPDDYKLSKVCGAELKGAASDNTNSTMVPPVADEQPKTPTEQQTSRSLRLARAALMVLGVASSLLWLAIAIGEYSLLGGYQGTRSVCCSCCREAARQYA